MDFDALLSMASQKQQELRQGAKPFNAVSLSLPAPKKLERKQVDGSAVRRILDEKRSRQVATAAGSSQAAASAAARPATSTQKERLDGAALAAVRGSATNGRPSSDSLRSDRDSTSAANGTVAGSSADVSAQRKAVHSSRPGSSSSLRNSGVDGSVGSSNSKAFSCKNTSTAGASSDLLKTAAPRDRSARERPPSTASKMAVAASATGSGSSADKKVNVSQPPSKPLSFSELMQLAAAKAADPSVATNVTTAASATTTAATAVSSSRPQPQQHRDRTASSSQAPAAGRPSVSTTAAANAFNGKPKQPVALVAAPASSGSNGSATVAPLQQQHQRKRRGKLPPELMDLLDIRDDGQGRSTSSSGTADKASAKTKEKSSTRTATDSNDVAKKSGKAGMPTGSRAAVGGGTATPQEPPKPRGIPKAQLAVAVLQKRKEAASAAAMALARQSVAGSAEPSKIVKPRAEAYVSPAGSHRGSGSAAQAGSQSIVNAQRSSSSAASRSEKSAAVASSKSAAKRDDGANLSVWDRIVGKSKATQKPKDSRKRRMIESDDDEYDEEMDDFIDDGDDYGQRSDISAEIKRIFGYDRSRFRDDDDDDANMEARFADVMKEEARSARIGREEDLEDMRMEEEYKKSKKRKKHGR